MRIKCIKNYYDIQLKREIKEGEELEVKPVRAERLLEVKVCEEVPTPTTDVATKPRVKTNGSKKRTD